MSVPKRKPKPYRIILDVNWYISASINRGSRKTIRKIFIDSRFTVLVSADLLAEYNLVIERKKFRKYFSSAQVARFRQLVLQKAELCAVHSDVSICRDPKNNYLLSLALDGKADYLISGDPDLQTIKKLASTKIVAMRTFLTRFRLRQPPAKEVPETRESATS